MKLTNYNSCSEIINPNNEEKENSIKIQSLQTSVDNLNSIVAELTTAISAISSSINDKYTTQTIQLTTKITEAVNDLQNDLANKSTTDLLVANNVQVSGSANFDLINSDGINTGVVQTDVVLAGDIVRSTRGTFTNLTADVANLSKAVIDLLEVATYVTNEVKANTVDATNIVAAKATIEKLTASLANIELLSASVITSKDEWKSPNSNPDNTELLKVTIPAYNGITNIITEDGKINISIINNTLLTFNQTDLYLYRVEFGGYGEFINQKIKLADTVTGEYSKEINPKENTTVSVKVNDTTSSFTAGEYGIVTEGDFTISYINEVITITSDNEDEYTVEIEYTELVRPKTEDKLVSLYFQEISPNYKELHIGSESFDESYSEIVDRTYYENNINSLSGTISATEITTDKNTNPATVTVETLPETGVENTLYIVLSTGESYMWIKNSWYPYIVYFDEEIDIEKILGGE